MKKDWESGRSGTSFHHEPEQVDTMNTPPTHDHGHALDESLRREARAWLRLFASGKVSQWDAMSFNRWRAASDRHGAAFDEARREWRLLGPAIGSLLAGDPAVAGAHRRAVQADRRQQRRAFIGAAAGAAAVVAVAAVHPPFGLWPAIADWDADFGTGPGERQRIVVADGVDVELNTRTRVRRQVADGRDVGIELIQGEAAIDLPETPAPFVVLAGSGRSIARAAHFQVKCVADTVSVTCIDGSVRIEHPAGVRTLHARQQLAYGERGLGGTQPAVPEDASAWRRGMLVFRQARLAEVIEEINRYRAGRVVLMAKEMSDNKVSGRFSTRDLEAVLLQIQHSFALNARTLPGGVVILS
ncbi:hypothetical protein CDO44_16125 [Pigmentiphaga sp. NML080357]|uniref:FecR family protein n=1 Tax=Pigmentiphaga sp. NML080357 TaxID=2008675 RepID=UPI000B40E9B4|nr:FecR domain-containing protein [Pigmentiphaga sp. NML080357]OVZ57908.1 hypothetical protein CDO44_16125 [Pigmentiphaga sp. NML080357]